MLRGVIRPISAKMAGTPSSFANGLWRWLLLRLTKDRAVKGSVYEKTSGYHIIENWPHSSYQSMQFAMEQQPQQPHDIASLRFRDAAGRCIIENQQVRLEFTCQHNSLSFALSHPGSQASYASLVPDPVPGNPLCLGDLHTPVAPLAGLDHLFVDCFRDMHGSRNLVKQIQATSSSEGDEGAGIQDQLHPLVPSRWRRVSRSR